MKKVENECVDCGLQCMGNACRYRNVVRFYCDECGIEGKLRRYNDRELCKDCLADEFEVVEGSDAWY